MSIFPCVRGVCIALCLLLYPLYGSAAGVNLTHVQSDPDADAPSLRLEFSAEPKWGQTVTLLGAEQELRLEFTDTANVATQDGYRREFSDAAGFVHALEIGEETEEDTTRVVVRLTFPLTSGATVAAGATPNVLIVKMTPGSSGAAVPLSARAGPSEATRADVRTLYIVGGLILLIGTGVVVGYLLLSGSGRKRARTAAVGVPAEEAKSLMREDVDAYRETSDAALDASHERHQRLVRIF